MMEGMAAFLLVGLMAALVAPGDAVPIRRRAVEESELQQELSEADSVSVMRLEVDPQNAESNARKLYNLIRLCTNPELTTHCSRKEFTRMLLTAPEKMDRAQRHRGPAASGGDEATSMDGSDIDGGEEFAVGSRLRRDMRGMRRRRSAMTSFNRLLEFFTRRARRGVPAPKPKVRPVYSVDSGGAAQADRNNEPKVVFGSDM